MVGLLLDAWYSSTINTEPLYEVTSLKLQYAT